MESISQLNPLAVAAATLVYFIFGALWFTPLFGKVYDDSLGFERPKGYKWAPIFYWMPSLSSLLSVLLINWLYVTIKPASMAEAMLIGAVVGLVGLSVSFNNAVTCNKPSPLKHGAVTGFYHLSASVLAVIVVHVIN